MTALLFHSMHRRSFISRATLAVGAATLGLARAAATTRPTRLIVRGDDMGFSHSGNLALVQCYREGIETAIEVIAPSPWFPEAVQLLNEKGNLGVDVGVHLCLTSEWDNVKWRPLTAATSLVDADGYFLPMLRPNKNYPGRSVAENKWQLADIEREFRAQIELVKRHVPRVSHVSSHMGSTGLSPEVASMSRRLAREFGVDIDLEEHDVKRINYSGPKLTAEQKLSSFLKTLESLERGRTYLFIEHPGLDTPELRAISHIGYENVAEDRQGVTDTCTHPRVKAFIKERGIQLIGYCDLTNTPL